MDTVSDVFRCLENGFGVKLSYLELEKQLQSRVHRQIEGVWEFADSLVEIERKMQDRRVREPNDRRWLLHMWFCRNLRQKNRDKAAEVVEGTIPGELGRTGTESCRSDE